MPRSRRLGPAHRYYRAWPLLREQPSTFRTFEGDTDGDDEAHYPEAH